MDFLKNRLQIQNTDAIVISDTHRLGKPPQLVTTPVRKPRDIIVRFQSGQDRTLVWNNRSKLKHSKFVLSEDFSQTAQEKINKLFPIYKAAKQHPSVNRCQLNRDILTINGQKFTLDSIDTLPYGLKDVNSSERQLKDDKGIAFFGKFSFLSNFYDSPFVENGTTFKTVEHYYQHKQAAYFKDTITATAILNAKTPGHAKALSHQIKDRDSELWQPVAQRTMHKACLMKFKQNPHLGEKLKQTRGMLVEANPKDTFFSCGLKLRHPDLDNPKLWTGKNILGEILCQVRDSV